MLYAGLYSNYLCRPGSVRGGEDLGQSYANLYFGETSLFIVQTESNVELLFCLCQNLLKSSVRRGNAKVSQPYYSY